MERGSEVEEQRRQIEALQKSVEKLSLPRGSGGVLPTPQSTGFGSGDRNGWLEEEVEGRTKGRGGGGGQIALDTAVARVRQQAGVIGQLQSQVASAKEAQEHAAEEVLRVSHQLARLKEGSTAGAELEELRRRHEMALVIIGERNERVGPT